jgi:hypothetical protein
MCGQLQGSCTHQNGSRCNEVWATSVAMHQMGDDEIVLVCQMHWWKGGLPLCIITAL